MRPAVEPDPAVTGAAELSIAPRNRNGRGAYNLLATELKVLVMPVPTNCIAAIAATAINAAISAYSMAVTPDLSSISFK
jgi:hypothetical protein